LSGAVKRAALNRARLERGAMPQIQRDLPTREDQHCGMTLEASRKHLRALDPKADTIVLDCGKSGLRNTSALSELILTQALQLANDAHRFTD
jgi:hypothetical protein